MHSSVPVAVTGWSTSSYLLAALNVVMGGGTLGAFGIWLKTRPKILEISQTGEERLRDDLMARVTKLEADAVTREREREAERARHEADIASMRHQLNNSATALEQLLLILDDDELPDRLKVKVQRIRELRTRQREAEERERDTIRAASLAAKIAPIT